MAPIQCTISGGDNPNIKGQATLTIIDECINTVTMILTNKIVGQYEARSYPDDDFNNNDKIELYLVDVHEIRIESIDKNNNKQIKIYSAPRLMPYWNDPQAPDSRYKIQGWVNAGLTQKNRIVVSQYKKDYQVHNRYSPGRGAIVIKNSFYIHAGPADLADIGFGSAGCIEIIGNYDNFKSDIKELSGIKNIDSDEVILRLIKHQKLIIEIEAIEVKDIKKRFTREV